MRRFVPYLLALFVVAALLRVDFFFTIVYLLLIVYILSRLWVQHTVNRLEIRRRFADHAFCGDTIPVDQGLRIERQQLKPFVKIDGNRMDATFATEDHDRAFFWRL